MIDVFNLISFIVLTSLVGILFVFGINLLFKNKRLSSALIQTQIDKKIISDQLEKIASEMQDKKIEQTDGFLKFVSESRDWAFEYIEDVQQSIIAVKQNWENNNQLEESLIKLFSYLPEQTNKEK